MDNQTRWVFLALGQPSVAHAHRHHTIRLFTRAFDTAERDSSGWRPLRSRSPISLLGGQLSSPRLVQEVLSGDGSAEVLFVYYIGKVTFREGGLLLDTANSSGSTRSKVGVSSLLTRLSDYYRRVYLVLDTFSGIGSAAVPDIRNLGVLHRVGAPSFGTYKGGDILSATMAEVIYFARRTLPQFSLKDLADLVNHRTRGKVAASFHPAGSPAVLRERCLGGSGPHQVWNIDRGNLDSANEGSREDGIQALLSASHDPSMRAEARFLLEYLSVVDPSPTVREAAIGVLMGPRRPASSASRERNPIRVAHAALPTWVEIPAGPFMMGSDSKIDRFALPEEEPQHLLFLPAFEIGRVPITRRQWKAFTDHQLGYEASEDISDSVPITAVSWYEALEFAEWLTALARETALIESDTVLTIPSEAEWEKSARGRNGLIYPWGNRFEHDRCNYRESGFFGPTPSLHWSPRGDSPYGVVGMAGNTWEWTRSLWGRGGRVPEFGYPYDAQDGREDLGAPSDVRRIIRGGAWYYYDWCVRAATRNVMFPETKHSAGGFRLVKIPESVVVRGPLSGTPIL